MNFYKRVLGAVALASVGIVPAAAQSGTNSPYSQYGLGLLNEQSSGFNRGMNGLGLGFREHNQVNYINPVLFRLGFVDVYFRCRHVGTDNQF